jgi:hypothetical protein
MECQSPADAAVVDIGQQEHSVGLGQKPRAMPSGDARPPPSKLSERHKFGIELDFPHISRPPAKLLRVTLRDLPAVGAVSVAAAIRPRPSIGQDGEVMRAPPDSNHSPAAHGVYFVAIDTPYPDAWIIVPAFNEAQVIGDVIADLRQVFDHVVCVDDGSRDDTGDVALRAGAHSVRHPVNLGQGAAIQTGVEYARRQPGAAVFATFDADGQHRVKDVIRMIDRLAGDDVDLVVGTRFADPGVVSHTPLLKRVVLRTAATLSRRSRKLGLTDAHNGLRVFNKKVADGLNLTMNGMSHADEFIALAYENGWRVTEEPVEILYTEYSMSKGQPLLNGVNIIFDGWLRGRMSR